MDYRQSRKDIYCGDKKKRKKNPEKNLNCSWICGVILRVIYFTIVVHIVLSSNVIGSNHVVRHKRLFSGKVAEDGKFPYVVFLKAVVHPEPIIAPLRCEEKLCTGTLIHTRFVLTVTSCVQLNKDDVNATDIKVFLKVRPYDAITKNMSYNTGLRIVSKSTGDTDNAGADNVALILMNDTFTEVKSFPKVLPIEPMSEGTVLKCSTVGFGLFGRNMSYPIEDVIPPMTFDIEGQLNISYCSTDNEDRKYNVYLCDIGEKSSESTLCEGGDEGSPLLCKSHLKSSGGGGGSTARYKMMEKLRFLKYNRWRVDRADDTGGSEDGLFIYGIADVVRTKQNCYSKNGTDKQDRNLFLYMLRYAAWINTVLEEFDEQELEVENLTSTTVSTTKLTIVPVASITLSTKLPEYYDMDDYINTMKKPIRCKNGPAADRRLTANFHRSSYIAQNKDSSIFGGETKPFSSGNQSSCCPVIRLVLLSFFLLIVTVRRLQ